MADLSSLTIAELLQELSEVESQLEESEQLGINFFMGIAGYLPDTTELKNYRIAICQEIESRQ